MKPHCFGIKKRRTGGVEVHVLHRDRRPIVLFILGAAGGKHIMARVIINRGGLTKTHTAA